MKVQIKKKEIKGEIKKYKYYSDNFQEHDPHAEKIKKENRIKKAKEKAKNIEKNRQKIIIINNFRKAYSFKLTSSFSRKFKFFISR